MLNVSQVGTIHNTRLHLLINGHVIAMHCPAKEFWMPVRRDEPTIQWLTPTCAARSPALRAPSDRRWQIAPALKPRAVEAVCVWCIACAICGTVCRAAPSATRQLNRRQHKRIYIRALRTRHSHGVLRSTKCSTNASQRRLDDLRDLSGKYPVAGCFTVGSAQATRIHYARRTEASSQQRKEVSTPMD